MQELKEICELVSSVGFPIVVCVYLMTVTDKRLREIRDAIRDMNHKQ
jgi:hypothetical protein